MAEYRPIYVITDVSKPGEYPYRPAITARQVIGVAGGYDITRIRMNNPYLESADLRTEYGSLWTEFAKEQTQMWRMKNELGEALKISPSALRDVPIAHSVILEIVNAGTEYLKTKQRFGKAGVVAQVCNNHRLGKDGADRYPPARWPGHFRTGAAEAR